MIFEREGSDKWILGKSINRYIEVRMWRYIWEIVRNLVWGKLNIFWNSWEIRIEGLFRLYFREFLMFNKGG